MTELKVTDRDILYINLADEEASYLTLPKEMRNIICAIRHVRGKVKNRLKENVAKSEYMYKVVFEAGANNQNLNRLQKEVVEAKDELNKYEEEEKVVLHWFKNQDPHLYEAAETYVRQQAFLCGCMAHSKKEEVQKEHDDWIESLKGDLTLCGSDTKKGMQTRKRTRKAEE